MKKILIVLLVLCLAVPVFAKVSKIHGEKKISEFLIQIHSNVESSRESVTRFYNKGKTYLNHYPGQVEGNDQKDFEDLEPYLLDFQNSANSLLTEIETKFPGITE